MQQQKPLMWTRVFVIASLVALSACSDSDTGSSQQTDEGFVFTAPADTDTLSNDLPESEVAAIVALGATGAERPPDDEHQHGDSHPGHSVNAEDQAILDVEIETARSMISDLDTIEKVAARGYVLATAPSAGIGTHWVRWSQILEPFSPGNPSMVLFDHSKSPPMLVGYSYAVQSASEPKGFTGGADMWHRHAGLCVALT
ncbi:MAG: hypothetical protein RL473_788, partial [Actinomycetota bacterium]